MTAFLFLFIVLLVLQVGDIWLTWRILMLGGQELNPLVRILMSKAGRLPGMVLPKLAMLVLLTMFPPPLPFMLAIICLYAWVVSHNVVQYEKIGGAA